MTEYQSRLEQKLSETLLASNIKEEVFESEQIKIMESEDELKNVGHF
jgi:hypothetical protein